MTITPAPIITFPAYWPPTRVIHLVGSYAVIRGARIAINERMWT